MSTFVVMFSAGVSGYLLPAAQVMHMGISGFPSTHRQLISEGLLTVMLQYTATQAIRRDFEAPGVRNVPIIAMTASAIQGDREKCEASGMNVSGHPFLEPKVAERCAGLPSEACQR